MSLFDVSHQYFFFLRVLLEVFLETLIADQLLLEFDSLLSHDVLGVKRHKDRFTSGLEATDFMPDDRDALKHIFTVEVFGEFLLEVLDAFDSLVLIRLDKSDHRSLLVRNEASSFFIGVICDRYIKVDNINNIFQSWGPLRITSV